VKLAISNIYNRSKLKWWSNHKVPLVLKLDRIGTQLVILQGKILIFHFTPWKLQLITSFIEIVTEYNKIPKQEVGSKKNTALKRY
jgi:hypothetical protein